MPTATLTEKGQIVIPAEIRALHGLTPGTQVEFVDEGGVIRLLVRRRVARSDPAAGTPRATKWAYSWPMVARRSAGYAATASLSRR